MYFKYTDRYRLKVKSRKKMYHAQSNHKKAGVTTLTSEEKMIKQIILLKIKKILQ